MVSQTQRPPVVREASIQTADKHVTDKISQTLAAPKLSEVSTQATTKQLSDVVSETEPLHVNLIQQLQKPQQSIFQVLTPQDNNLNGVTETQEKSMTNGGSTQKNKTNKNRVMEMVGQMGAFCFTKTPKLVDTTEG